VLVVDVLVAEVVLGGEVTGAIKYEVQPDPIIVNKARAFLKAAIPYEYKPGLETFTTAAESGPPWNNATPPHLAKTNCV